MTLDIVENRLIRGVWICQRCNAKNRSGNGKKPDRCRKCESIQLRLKRKAKK